MITRSKINKESEKDENQDSNLGTSVGTNSTINDSESEHNRSDSSTTSDLNLNKILSIKQTKWRLR